MEALVDDPDGSPPRPADADAGSPLGEVERETRRLSSRVDLQATGFEIGEFADYEDFEEGADYIVTWLRDNGYHATFGVWQILMKELAQLYPDTAIARDDPELNLKLSVLRTELHLEAYGPKWKKGTITPVSLRPAVAPKPGPVPPGFDGQSGAAGPLQDGNAARATPGVYPDLSAGGVTNRQAAVRNVGQGLLGDVPGGPAAPTGYLSEIVADAIPKR